MAAASSECSSGCQSGWTTYLDSSSGSSSCYSRGAHGKLARQQQPGYYYCSEEEDLSMISDASSGPRHQCSAGNDAEGACAHANADRRGRRAEGVKAAKRQSKRVAAASSLLEDTASSPAFFGYSKPMSSTNPGNGYGDFDATVMEIGNLEDFSGAFSATTGFKSPLTGIPLGGGYLPMQYPSPAPAKPMHAHKTGVQRRH